MSSVGRATATSSLYMIVNNNHRNRLAYLLSIRIRKDTYLFRPMQNVVRSDPVNMTNKNHQLICKAKRSATYN